MAKIIEMPKSNHGFISQVDALAEYQKQMGERMTGQEIIDAWEKWLDGIRDKSLRIVSEMVKDTNHRFDR